MAACCTFYTWLLVTTFLLTSAEVRSEGTAEPVELLVKFPTIKKIIKLSHQRHLKDLNKYLKDNGIKDIIVVIHITSLNVTNTVALQPSALLLPKTLKVTSFDERNKPTHSFLHTGDASCFYDGKTSRDQARFHLCGGEVEGEVILDNYTYSISSSAGEDGQLKITATKKLETILGKCGNSDDAFSNVRHRKVRDVHHAPAFRDNATRYIEMYVVVDYGLYKRSNESKVKTVARLIKIINYSSSLYRKMNIYLALVGVEIWNTGNKFNVIGSVDTVLTDFESYRRTVINRQSPNDNAQLFVEKRFDDGTIGKGSSSICSHVGGAAVTVDHYEDRFETAATTLVHELGHNLGLQHDDTLPNKEECTCPRADGGDDHCIMHSISGYSKSHLYVRSLARRSTAKRH